MEQVLLNTMAMLYRSQCMYGVSGCPEESPLLTRIMESQLNPVRTRQERSLGFEPSLIDKSGGSLLDGPLELAWISAVPKQAVNLVPPKA
jgi:hypothetical protein